MSLYYLHYVTYPYQKNTYVIIIGYNNPVSIYITQIKINFFSDVTNTNSGYVNKAKNCKWFRTEEPKACPRNSTIKAPTTQAPVTQAPKSKTNGNSAPATKPTEKNDDPKPMVAKGEYSDDDYESDEEPTPEKKSGVKARSKWKLCWWKELN